MAEKKADPWAYIDDIVTDESLMGPRTQEHGAIAMLLLLAQKIAFEGIQKARDWLMSQKARRKRLIGYITGTSNLAPGLPEVEHGQRRYWAMWAEQEEAEAATQELLSAPPPRAVNRDSVFARMSRQDPTAVRKSAAEDEEAQQIQLAQIMSMSEQNKKPAAAKPKKPPEPKYATEVDFMKARIAEAIAKQKAEEAAKQKKLVELEKHFAKKNEEKQKKGEPPKPMPPASRVEAIKQRLAAIKKEAEERRRREERIKNARARVPNESDLEFDGLRIGSNADVERADQVGDEDDEEEDEDADE